MVRNKSQRYNLVTHISNILMSLWVGGGVCTLAITIPVLSSKLPNAESLALYIIHINTFIGIVLAITAGISIMINKRFASLKSRRFYYVLLMLCCLILNYLTTIPIIDHIRTHIITLANHVMSVEDTNFFSVWHCLSTVIFGASVFIGICYLIDINS